MQRKIVPVSRSDCDRHSPHCYNPRAKKKNFDCWPTTRKAEINQRHQVANALCWYELSSDNKTYKNLRTITTTKTIVTTPDWTNDLAIAPFKWRQLQKIQVSNKFPQKKRRKRKLRRSSHYIGLRARLQVQDSMNLSSAMPGDHICDILHNH